MVTQTGVAFTGGVVRPADAIDPELLEQLRSKREEIANRAVSWRTAKNQKRQAKARGELPKQFDLADIDVEGPLPGDPHQLRMSSDGTIYKPDDRARATEKRRRRCRAELQAAIAAGHIPEELQKRAMVLLKKGRFANRVSDLVTLTAKGEAWLNENGGDA